MKKILAISIVLLILLICIPQNTIASEDLSKYVLSKNQNDLSEKNLNRILRLMTKIGHMPSLSACVVKDDEIVWQNYYGEYDLKNNKKPTNNTIYNIGSITKSFIAVSILQLYEDGLIGLDDNVSKWLPFDLKNPNFPEINITFRMLLTHQSSRYDVINGNPGERRGFFEYIFFVRDSFGLFLNSPYETVHEWVMEFYHPDGSRYDPNLWGSYPPGTGVSYSNDGFIILGYLLERITGQPFEEYIQENILGPLEMNDTSFYIADLDEERLAVPYYWACGIYFPVEQYDFFGGAPCGGLETTINDLSKYLMVHMSNGSYKNVQILKNETLRLMHARYASIGSIYLGFGWASFSLSDGEIEEGHSGETPGFSAQMWMHRNSKVGVIMFYNNNYPSPIFRGYDPLETFSKNIILKNLFSYGENL